MRTYSFLSKIECHCDLIYDRSQIGFSPASEKSHHTHPIDVIIVFPTDGTSSLFNQTIERN
jgi:hypothetical protein